MYAQATVDRARAMFLTWLATADAPEQGPADMPCACTAPQYAHGGPRAAGGCKDTGCARYRPSAVHTLAERAWQGWWATAGSDLRWHADHVHATDPTRKPREAGQIGVTPSDIGECRRKIWYREAPPEGFVPDPEDKREAMIGGVIHDGLMRARAERYSWRSFEGRVLVPGLDREGKYDEYDPVAATLVETKCTTLDTPVLMADGTEKNAGDIRAGDRLVAWDETRERLVSAPVSWTGDNGVQPIYTVRTRMGRVVRVTAEHPFLVATPSPKGGTSYEWIKADGLRSGMKAVLAMGWEPETPETPGPAQATDERTCSVPGCGAAVASRKPLTARRKPSAVRMCPGHSARTFAGKPSAPLRPVDDPLTPADGYLLGALVGDGGLTGMMDGRDDAIRFTSADPGILAAVDAALRPWGASLRNGGRPYDFRVVFDGDGLRSRRFRAWLARHDMAHGAHAKRVPEAVQSAPEAVRYAYLAGYVDTDGTVTGWDVPGTGGPTRVVCGTVSEVLARQTANLLAGLDVRAAVNTIRTSYKGAPHVSHNVVVPGAYGVKTLAASLPLAGVKSSRLAVLAAKIDARGGAARPRMYDYVTIDSVTVDAPEPTVAIEVQGVHTLVTGGLITHNTAGEYVWERIHEGGPRVEHVQQAQLYALALDRAGLPVAVVKVLYVRRSNGHEVSWTFPYDEKAALAAVDWLLGVVTALDLGDELPRDRTGPTNDPLCRRCFARTHCWNLPAAEAAGRSPESFTVLGADPDADAIEYQLAQYVDARERENAAKRDKDAAKVLVDGVEAGTYGDYHVGERSSYRKDDAALMDAIRAAWNAPEHERPDLDDLLANPPKRRVSSVDIGRVSAARRGREAREAAVRAAAAEAAGGAR